MTSLLAMQQKTERTTVSRMPPDAAELRVAPPSYQSFEGFSGVHRGLACRDALFVKPTAPSAPSVGANHQHNNNNSNDSEAIVTGAAPTGEWDDDDCAFMEFLLMDTPELELPTPSSGAPLPPPQEVVVVPPHPQPVTHPLPQANTPATQPLTMGPVATPIQVGKATKATSTATNRRERHREVVRRSYHRNKQALMELRATVKDLETKFRELSCQEDLATSGPTANAATASSLVSKLKQECAAMDTETEALRWEFTQLQNALKEREAYARIIQETQFDTSDESTTSDEDDAMSSTASPSTSEEDFSPLKKRTLGSLPMNLAKNMQPTHMVDLSPPAALDREMINEVGFRPLSLVSAKKMVTQAYQGILDFNLSGRAVSTGAVVLGWEDKRLLDGTALRFALRKSFHGLSSRDLMERTWQCFSDPDCTQQKFNGLAELRILQRVNDDMLVALRDTIDPALNKVFRSVYLLFRLRTKTGFVMCTRSLNEGLIAGKTQKKFTSSGVEIQWVDWFGWFIFNQQGYLQPSSYFQETGSKVEYGGFVDYKAPSHLPTLAMNTLSMVLRWESLMVAPQFSLPPST